MCLPHCPTYVNTQLESESPRGRIAIIQGLLNKEIKATQTALSHIDNCLNCRACEKICPSVVNYGAMLDQFRAQQRSSLKIHNKRLLKSAIRFVLLNSMVNSFTIKTARLLHFHRAIGISKKLTTQSRSEYQKNKTLYPTQYSTLQSKNNTIGLFVGCTGSSFDTQTLNDVIYVLNSIGFDVKLSHATKCCGALDSHAGRQQSASTLALKNIEAFNALNVDKIVYFASGCGAQLSEYHLIDWQTEQQQQNASVFTKKLSEVSLFIHSHWPEKIKLQNATRVVAIHEPCTHRNVLKQSDIGYQLLKRIPDLSILALKQNKFCCGAAGDYMFIHKKMAHQLRAPKIKEIKQLNPDLIVTTNIGCALHLRKGLAQDKLAIPLMHPVSFIAELLIKT